MANSNDNDLDTKVQGKQGVHIKKVFEASKRLGLLDTNPLSMENKAAILAEAGLPLNGNLSTAYVYREHGRHIEAVVGLDKPLPPIGILPGIHKRLPNSVIISRVGRDLRLQTNTTARTNIRVKISTE